MSDNRSSAENRSCSNPQKPLPFRSSPLNVFFNSFGGTPINRKARVLLGLWSVFLMAGFTLAIQLEPDSRGYGTHQSLGLPPCTIRMVYDIPCPSCGMTTSFSYFVRGEFRDSLRANFAGFYLAMICAFQVPWSWASLYSGRLLGVNRLDFFLIFILSSVLLLSMAQWAVQISF